MMGLGSDVPVLTSKPRYPWTICFRCRLFVAWDDPLRPLFFKDHSSCAHYLERPGYWDINGSRAETVRVTRRSLTNMAEDPALNGYRPAYTAVERLALAGRK